MTEKNSGSCYEGCKHHLMLVGLQHNQSWCLRVSKPANELGVDECNFEQGDGLTHYIRDNQPNPNVSIKNYMDQLEFAKVHGRCVDCANVKIYEDYIEPVKYTLVDLLNTCPHKHAIDMYKGGTYRLHIEDMQRKYGDGCFKSKESK